MLLLSVTLGIPLAQVRTWPSHEISLYMAYYRIDPWGEQRADLRSAMRLAQTAEMHRDKQKRPEPFTYDEFMPFQEKSQDAQEMTLRARARQMFGRLK